jgi:hypothetical protein
MIRYTYTTKEEAAGIVMQYTHTNVGNVARLAGDYIEAIEELERLHSKLVEFAMRLSDEGEEVQKMADNTVRFFR